MLSLSVIVRSGPPSCGGVAAALRMANRRGVGTFVEPSFVHSLLLSEKKVKLLDVRHPDQYTESHIPDAVSCHSIFTYLATTSDSSGAAELRNTFEGIFQKAGINGDEHVITYESSLHSLYGSSCRGLFLLKLLGHPTVSILNGGFDKWIRQGYPTSKDIPKVETGHFRSKWTPSMLSNRDDVIRAIKDKSAILLDVRDIDEWNGTSSSPYGADFTPRKGRLPGAVHILWRDFMEKGEDGLMYVKNADKVLELCAARGITPDKTVIVYCFKGARASNALVALREAGFNKASNYFASWNEWSRDPDLIIDSEVYD